MSAIKYWIWFNVLVDAILTRIGVDNDACKLACRKGYSAQMIAAEVLDCFAIKAASRYSSTPSRAEVQTLLQRAAVESNEERGTWFNAIHEAEEAAAIPLRVRDVQTGSIAMARLTTGRIVNGRVVGDPVFTVDDEAAEIDLYEPAEPLPDLLKRAYEQGIEHASRGGAR